MQADHRQGGQREGLVQGAQVTLVGGLAPRAHQQAEGDAGAGEEQRRPSGGTAGDPEEVGCDVHRSLDICRERRACIHDLDRAAVRHDHPAVGEPRRGPRRAREQRRLRVDLGAQSGGRDRGRLDHPGERRLPAAGVEQVMGGLSVGPDPAPAADSARGNGAVAQAELVDRLAAGRIADRDPTLLAGVPRRCGCLRSSRPRRPAGPRARPPRGRRRRPFAIPPLSISRPGDLLDRAGSLVDANLAPAPVRVRPRRRSTRRLERAGRPGGRRAPPSSLGSRPARARRGGSRRPAPR